MFTFVYFCSIAQSLQVKIMFYERYCELCQERGKSPSGVAVELGISKSAVSTWKNLGRVPKMETLQRLADYFGVTVDYLVGNVNEPFFYLDNKRILDEINDTGNKKDPALAGKVSDEDIKFALFDGAPVTDAQYEEVKRFARYIAENNIKPHD